MLTINCKNRTHRVSLRELNTNDYFEIVGINELLIKTEIIGTSGFVCYNMTKGINETHSPETEVIKCNNIEVNYYI